MSQRFLAALVASELKAQAQGHSILDVLATASKNAFGTDVRPSEADIDAVLAVYGDDFEDANGVVSRADNGTFQAVDPIAGSDYYSKFTVSELKTELDARSIVYASNAPKADLVDALVADDAAKVN